MTTSENPKRNKLPWSEDEILALEETATKNFLNGDINIPLLAKIHERNESAITTRLSLSGWYESHGLGKKYSPKSDEVVKYVFNHPWCTSTSASKALGRDVSGTMFHAIKANRLIRIKPKGGQFQYNIHSNEYAKEPATVYMAYKPEETSLSLLERFKKFLSGLFGSV